MMPPSWFFWAFSLFFALGCPAFLLPWVFKRRRYLELEASLVRAEGVVVDRIERTIERHGEAPRTRVEVTVEYRDHLGRVHQMTDDEGRFFRFVGDTTPVLDTRGAPADARLEVSRGAEHAFFGLTMLFAGLTALFVGLALLAPSG